MKSFKNAAVAAVLLLALGAAALLTPAAEASPDKLHALARKTIARTHAIVLHGWHAAKKEGQLKADLRMAVVDQRAARRALKGDKPALAMRLSLAARALARKVIQANKDTLKDEEAKDTPEETKASEGATEADATAATKAEEKTTPPADDILKEEPKDEDPK